MEILKTVCERDESELSAVSACVLFCEPSARTEKTASVDETVIWRAPETKPRPSLSLRMLSCSRENALLGCEVAATPLFLLLFPTPPTVDPRADDEDC